MACHDGPSFIHYTRHGEGARSASTGSPWTTAAGALSRPEIRPVLPHPARYGQFFDFRGNQAHGLVLESSCCICLIEFEVAE